MLISTSTGEEYVFLRQLSGKGRTHQSKNIQESGSGSVWLGEAGEEHFRQNRKPETPGTEIK